MEEAGADLVKNVKRKSNTPEKDADLGSQGRIVAATWKKNSLLKLVWTNADEFETIVNSYLDTLTERLSTGGGRKEVIGKLGYLIYPSTMVYRPLKDTWYISSTKPMPLRTIRNLA